MAGLLYRKQYCHNVRRKIQNDDPHVRTKSSKSIDRDNGQNAVRQSAPLGIPDALPLQQYVDIDTEDPDVPLVSSIMG